MSSSSSCRSEELCTPIHITEDANLTGFRLFSADADNSNLFYSDAHCTAGITPTNVFQGLPLWSLKKNQQVYTCLGDNEGLFFQYTYILGNPQPYYLSSMKKDIP